MYTLAAKLCAMISLIIAVNHYQSVTNLSWLMVHVHLFPESAGILPVLPGAMAGGTPVLPGHLALDDEATRAGHPRSQGRWRAGRPRSQAQNER